MKEKKWITRWKAIFMIAVLFFTEILSCIVGIRKVSAEEIGAVIVDNTNTESVECSGTWKNGSSRSGKYGSNYRVGVKNTQEDTWFQWNFNAPVSGEITVSFWVPDSDADVHDINSEAVYTIQQQEEVLDSKTIDQRGKGGEWSLLGTYEFQEGKEYSVRVNTGECGDSVNTFADAVKFEYKLPENQHSIITLDNKDAEITGEWTNSTYRKGYYGEDYLTVASGNEDAFVTYTPEIKTAGNYAVYTQLPKGDSDLTADAPYIIEHENGISTEKVNQQGTNAVWSLVGIYEFAKGTNAKVTVKSGKNGYTVADAIRFELVDKVLDSSTVEGQDWSVHEHAEAVNGTYLQTNDAHSLYGKVRIPQDGYYNIRYSLPAEHVSEAENAELCIDDFNYEINTAQMQKGYNLIDTVYLKKEQEVSFSLTNKDAQTLIYDAIIFEHTRYNAVFDSFELEESLEDWKITGESDIVQGALSITDGEVQRETEGCLNVVFEAAIVPEVVKEASKFGMILSGSNNSYLLLYIDTATDKLVLFDEQADKLVAESHEAIPWNVGEQIVIRTAFSYPEVTVEINGTEYINTEYSRSGSVGFFAENSTIKAEYLGGNKTGEVMSNSGEYTLELDKPAQTIWGLGIEVQSDSIGSGNNGLPESQVRSVPYGLEQSERERLYTEMLPGFRYLRFAGGLYYRGTDEEEKHLKERWETQNEELAELIQMSGIEGIDFEFWSPTPYFKASGSYIHGNSDSEDGLRCFSSNFANDPIYHGDKQKFLEDFADTIVADLKMLEENGVPVVQWGLQNEAPHWVRSYSHCKYTEQEYYETMKVVVPKIREAFPDIHIHADSWNGQYSEGSKKIIKDQELLNEIDGWTFHRIGYDSDDQINNRNFYNSEKGRDDIPVYNNEFEYFSDTSDWKCINTAQSLMNWMTFENSPTWHWLHMLKPFGNSEASGYSLGYFRPYDYKESENVPTGFEDVEPGHWDYNYQNWNSVRGFLKYMPWNSIRYEVSEDQVRGDNRIMSWQTPDGKQVIALTNRSQSDLFTFNISTGIDDTWKGYRYTPKNENEIQLGTLSGETISPILPPLSIEFWVQEGTREVPDRGVELEEQEIELEEMGTETLTAVIKEENPAIPGLTWSSSDNTVASVDKNGVVQAISEGSAVIKVTRKDGGFSDTCKVTVLGVGGETAEPNKENLGLAIAMAEKLEKEQNDYKVYTEETWAAVQTALEAAREVFESSECTQEEADSAFLELMTAINLLESDVQKAGLGTAIEGAEAILTGIDAETAGESYTQESVEAIRTALNEAKSVYNNPEATQTEINHASTNLMTAVNNLLVAEADSRLDILIQKAEELLLKENQYTDDSVQALRDALEAAKEVAGREDASEEEINNAYNTLAEAMTSLVRVANKAELQNALEKAGEILENAGKYVESSLSGLQEAKDAAQAVYEEDSASQGDIETALNALINEILEVRILGDVNADEQVDSADAQEVLRYSAEMSELSQEQLEAADVNRDEAADSSDAGRILQYTAEVITEF